MSAATLDRPGPDDQASSAFGGTSMRADHVKFLLFAAAVLTMPI